jgi:hypothetical protein
MQIIPNRFNQTDTSYVAGLSLVGEEFLAVMNTLAWPPNPVEIFDSVPG